jgi:hypothetical protein
MLWRIASASVGMRFTGPTFLEDDEASEEAESAWIQIDELFKKMPHPARKGPTTTIATVDIERAFTEWENSLL